jgi:molybdate transport system regulatory protein
MPTIGPLKLKVQVICGDTGAMGPGKADLLDAIDRTGSISAAGRDLGMSYRRAWMLVDEMNRCWSDRLVDTRSGGGDRRGARLTACGHEVLQAYRTLEAAVVEGARGDALDRLQALLRADPVIRSGAA